MLLVIIDDTWYRQVCVPQSTVDIMSHNIGLRVFWKPGNLLTLLPCFQKCISSFSPFRQSAIALAYYPYSAKEISLFLLYTNKPGLLWPIRALAIPICCYFARLCFYTLYKEYFHVLSSMLR